MCPAFCEDRITKIGLQPTQPQSWPNRFAPASYKVSLDLLKKAVDMLCRSLAHGRDILDSKVKWAVVGLALVTVVVLGVLMVYRAAFSTELNSDFTTYRAAGWAVLTRSDIYEA